MTEYPVPPVPSPAHGSLAVGPLRRWLRQTVGRLIVDEASDLPASLTAAGSVLAAVYSLGNFVSSGLLAALPFQLARLAIYGSTLVGGLIIAAGFLSQARTARAAAIWTTVAVSTSYFALQYGLPDGTLYVIRSVYGIGIAITAAAWTLGAIRRRLRP